MVGFPWSFSDTPASCQSPAPELGQHTEQILLELGLSDVEIGELRVKRIIQRVRYRCWRKSKASGSQFKASMKQGRKSYKQLKAHFWRMSEKEPKAGIFVDKSDQPIHQLIHTLTLVDIYIFRRVTLTLQQNASHLPGFVWGSSIQIHFVFESN